MTEKPTVVLENWTRLHYFGADILAGNAHGHPNFDDGTFVYTSSIVNDGGEVVETRNTFYKLGVPAAVTYDGS